MAYNRFLTDKDYCSIATEEHMRQIIREMPERVPQAEQRAEMQFLEYLDQYYEIEKVLAVGKNIRAYSPMVSYPGQVWIKHDEEIYKTLTSINGIKKPTKKVYWKQVVDFINPFLIDHAKKYSQLRTYAKGEVVKFGTEYWQCDIPHGYEGGEIHMPGVNAWQEVEVTEWEPNLVWQPNDVCKYEGVYYQYLGDSDEEAETTPESPKEEDDPDKNTGSDVEGDTEIETLSDENEVGAIESEDEETSDNPEDDSIEDEPTDELLTPDEDELWGLIGEYSEDLEYLWGEGDHDYVVAEDAVFRPILNPNPDELKEGVNIVRDDPRNQNIVSHMARIALYNLHMIISPANISETRRWAYEDSVKWLYNASKFKINPQLPRKREKGGCEPKVDWACATFQKDYNPHENAWLI